MRKSDQQKTLNNPASLLGTCETTPGVLSQDVGSWCRTDPDVQQ